MTKKRTSWTIYETTRDGWLAPGWYVGGWEFHGPYETREALEHHHPAIALDRQTRKKTQRALKSGRNALH